MSKYIAMNDDSKETRKAQVNALPSDVIRIGTNFKLPEGTHQLLVTDKDAFGILIIEVTKGAQAGKKFSLNLVAGTITTNEGIVHTIENTDKAGAKTLAFPDTFFLEMACNGDYDVTVNELGRVTDVVPAKIAEPVAEEAKAGK